MNEFYTRNVLEAALLAAGKPLQIADLGQLFDENTRPSVDDIRAALEALAAEYSNRGLEVKETAAGFRIQVRREFASEISRLWPERPARYSRALLETLALIAYRQPITRAEIEAVRGVAVNPNIVKTVIERNWVRVVGHRDVPGRPELLGTTREFLDYFGLRSLDELPPLAELKAMGDYNLQLELPNAGALGVERGDVEVEGTDGVAVAVAGLLGSEVVVEAGDAAGGDAAGEAVVDAVADVGSPLEEGAAPAAAANGEAGHGAVADAAGARDAVASAAEGAHGPVDDMAGAQDAVADAQGAHDVANPAAAHADRDAGEVMHDAVADAQGVHDVANPAATHADGEAGEGVHGAVADAQGTHDVDSGSHAAAAHVHGDVGEGAHDDTEAERTLTSGNLSKRAADSDETDTSDSAISSESLDALDDAADDDVDEDELPPTVTYRAS